MVEVNVKEFNERKIIVNFILSFWINLVFVIIENIRWILNNECKNDIIINRVVMNKIFLFECDVWNICVYIFVFLVMFIVK